MITFRVYGKPATQGSKKGHVVHTNDGRTIAVVREDNPKLSQWRQQAAEVATEHFHGEPTAEPVGLAITFYRARPKSHFGTGCNAGKLKSSAAGYPTARPDVLKLARAVEDALTGIAYRDDSQVVVELLRKRWGNTAGCLVTVGTPEEITSLLAQGKRVDGPEQNVLF